MASKAVKARPKRSTVMGNLLFGTFIVGWIATMTTAFQDKAPIQLYPFEDTLMQTFTGSLNNDNFAWSRESQETWGTWLRDNYWIPAMCSTAYFVMLRCFEPFMESYERPGFLKPVTMIWNLVLSLSSSFALWRMLADLRDPSTIPSQICSKKCYRPLTCIYAILFCMSKIPELVDTFWLVLGKKKIKFLHWFHHVTVMWFCWFAASTMSWVGWAFSVMNLSVHSIMYMWYALAAADGLIYSGLKPGRTLSQLLTVLQIVQMIIGSGISVYIAVKEDCENGFTVVQFGLAMYFIYLVLFVHFFLNAYCVMKIVPKTPVKKKVT